MFKIAISSILFVMTLFAFFANANASRSCSAILSLQKSEVMSRVTAIAQVIAKYQMLVGQGLKGDLTAYIEAIHQLNLLVNEYPELIQYYQAELKRFTINDTKTKTQVKRAIKREKLLNKKIEITEDIAVLLINNEPHFIFKEKKGKYFVIGSNKEFSHFISELKDIQKIVTTKFNHGIAVLIKDGTVSTWGDKKFSDTSHLDLTNIKSIHATGFSFAALKHDGTVLTWGEAGTGGDSTGLNLTQVKEIYSNGFAFAALKSDHSVITWGDKYFGGDSQHLELKNVKEIYSTNLGFGALKFDNTFVSWRASKTLHFDVVDFEISDVQSVYVTQYAYLIQKKDGSFVTRGAEQLGGALPNHNLENIKEIVSTEDSFAALKNDDTVVSWGSKFIDYSDVSNFKNVKKIFSNNGAFAALTYDGKVLTWGFEHFGGNSMSVQKQLHDIEKVFAIQFGFKSLTQPTGAFIAQRKDGALILWGAAIGEFENQKVDFSLLSH